jgi:hypothetical protein
MIDDHTDQAEIAQVHERLTELMISQDLLLARVRRAELGAEVSRRERDAALEDLLRIERARAAADRFVTKLQVDLMNLQEMNLELLTEIGKVSAERDRALAEAWNARRDTDWTHLLNDPPR